MTPVEIIALILALAVLIKILVIIVKPTAWVKFIDPVIKNSKVMVWICLILAATVGYYLLQELTVVQIVASMLFVSLLMGMSLYSYPEIIISMKKQVIKKGNLFKKNWLTIIVWVGIAVYTLYVLFA